MTETSKEARLRKSIADADRSELALRREHLAWDQEQFEDKSFTANSRMRRIYPLHTQITAQAVEQCIEVVSTWAMMDPAKPITIRINTPGGGVFEGLSLYDALISIRNDGTPINTEAHGMCASMGAVLFQAGEIRRMTRRAYLMIHEISSGSSGKVSELQESLALSQRLQEDCLQILASRSSLTTEEIETRWVKRDWFINSSEAIELGLADV